MAGFFVVCAFAVFHCFKRKNSCLQAMTDKNLIWFILCSTRSFMAPETTQNLFPEHSAGNCDNLSRQSFTSISPSKLKWQTPQAYNHGTHGLMAFCHNFETVVKMFDSMPVSWFFDQFPTMFAHQCCVPGMWHCYSQLSLAQLLLHQMLVPIKFNQSHKTLQTAAALIRFHLLEHESWINHRHRATQTLCLQTVFFNQWSLSWCCCAVFPGREVS